MIPAGGIGPPGMTPRTRVPFPLPRVVRRPSLFGDVKGSRKGGKSPPSDMSAVVIGSLWSEGGVEAWPPLELLG